MFFPYYMYCTPSRRIKSAEIPVVQSNYFKAVLDFTNINSITDLSYTKNFQDNIYDILKKKLKHDFNEYFNDNLVEDDLISQTIVDCNLQFRNTNIMKFDPKCSPIIYPDQNIQLKAEDETTDEDVLDTSVTKSRLSKGDKLNLISQNKPEYTPFRKNFYICASEIIKMKDHEVKEYRKKLGGIKVRGNHVERPIKTWCQVGLNHKIIEFLYTNGFNCPSPIQAQALPIIMSGRDCIGIAKTGSGKTLAFVLPMVRHVKNQSVLKIGEGPISLILVPTRELVHQIMRDVKCIAQLIGLSVTFVHGGSGISSQISELKRRPEIVVCTPGRMIDLLVTSNGKITNLNRLTYLVLDEADRMFDMGFEPQVNKIVQITRNDRQTVLFSATFPRAMELLAREILHNPIEILVGGRSVVNKDIKQQIELRPNTKQVRMLRLLQILSEHNLEKVIVFVKTQLNCDTLFKELLSHGYPCMSLHGGRDQSDRESTIVDFKNGVIRILIATSVAARGLDVRGLNLVVNYDVPGHYEDYVHRVGRTGRAGQKGLAITFIDPKTEKKYASDLIRALKDSDQIIPKDLLELASECENITNLEVLTHHGSGYGGSGYKFSEIEEEIIKKEKEMVQSIYAPDDFESCDRSETGQHLRKESNNIVCDHRTMCIDLNTSNNRDSLTKDLLKTSSNTSVKLDGYQSLGESVNKCLTDQKNKLLTNQNVVSKLAASLASKMMTQPSHHVRGNNGPNTSTNELHKNISYKAELNINDFHQSVRRKTTSRDILRDIAYTCGVSINVRGKFFKPNETVPSGEKKLHLALEGSTDIAVREAKQMISQIIKEQSNKALRIDDTLGTVSIL